MKLTFAKGLRAASDPSLAPILTGQLVLVPLCGLWCSCTGLEYAQALVNYGSNIFLLASISNDGLTGHQLLDDVLVTPGHDQHHLQQLSLKPTVCDFSSCAGLPEILEDGGQVAAAGHLLL